MGVTLHRLSELKIELTQECPLACAHCSTSSHRNQSSSLPFPRVFRLLHEARDLGVENIVFTGGEPLVYPQLLELVSEAAKLGLRPTVYTSGIKDNHLSSMRVDDANALLSAGVQRFIFSVYSRLALVHDDITRYGTHAATLSAVRNASSAGGYVEIHFVALKRNFRELPGVVNLAAELGATRVSVLRFVPQGRGVRIRETDELDREALRELAALITEVRATYPALTIRAGSPLNVLLIGDTPCNAAHDVLIINHRGEIFPCDAFKNISVPDAQYGSILRAPLKEVWERSLYLNRVRAILGAHAGEECRACREFDGCRSGCLAQKVLQEGWSGTQIPDPSCLVQIQSVQATDADAPCMEAVA